LECDFTPIVTGGLLNFAKQYFLSTFPFTRLNFWQQLYYT
jgi:hypothetical protein